jgi:hypothetical protein
MINRSRVITLGEAQAWRAAFIVQHGPPTKTSILEPENVSRRMVREEWDNGRVRAVAEIGLRYTETFGWVPHVFIEVESVDQELKTCAGGRS